jgi:hypothetical protein
MPSKGKAKGNSWERELSRLLEESFKLPFQRVPNSGAFLGGANSFRRANLDSKQERIMTGDLIVPEQLNHISFECKFYKSFDYHLLYQRNKQFEGWVDQAIDGCNTDQIWFLCIKANRRLPIIAFSSPYFLEYLSSHNYATYNYRDQLIYITDLKDFIPSNKDLLLSLGKR